MAQNWVQHTLERTGWRTESQAAALVVLGVMLTLIFGGVYLSQVASYTTISREVSDLLVERDRLEFANEQLRADIAAFQTIPRLLARAEELGFRPAGNADIEYLVVDGYNPNRDRTVVPLAQLQEAVLDTPVYEETFSNWLQQSFDSLRQQFETFGQ